MAVLHTFKLLSAFFLKSRVFALTYFNLYITSKIFSTYLYTIIHHYFQHFLLILTVYVTQNPPCGHFLYTHHICRFTITLAFLSVMWTKMPVCFVVTAQLNWWKLHLANTQECLHQNNMIRFRWRTQYKSASECATTGSNSIRQLTLNRLTSTATYYYRYSIGSAMYSLNTCN